MMTLKFCGRKGNDLINTSSVLNIILAEHREHRHGERREEMLFIVKVVVNFKDKLNNQTSKCPDHFICKIALT